MSGMRVAFVTGALTGVLGCLAATIVAQEAGLNGDREDPVVLPPGSTPNAIMIMATNQGRISIRDEWGWEVTPDTDSSGRWETVVEVLIERQIDDADVGLQHVTGERHNHCRVSAASATFTYHC